MRPTPASALADANLDRSAQLHHLMVGWRIRLDRNRLPELARREGFVTQEEMAFLCRVTASYFGALERGHLKRRYSDSLLETFARVAGLSQAERRALYLLTTGREPVPRICPPADIAPALLAQQNCQPWPTYVTNPTWDLLACNNATWRWLPFLRQQSNVMRAMFLHPQARLQLVDWETAHVPNAIALLRGRFSQIPHDTKLQTLIGDVLRASPEARRMWAMSASVQMHDDGDRYALYLPGVEQPTVVEVVTSVPGRNPQHTVTSMIPQDGYIPSDCIEYLRAHTGIAPAGNS